MARRLSQVSHLHQHCTVLFEERAGLQTAVNGSWSAKPTLTADFTVETGQTTCWFHAAQARWTSPGQIDHYISLIGATMCIQSDGLQLSSCTASHLLMQCLYMNPAAVPN